MKVIQTWHIPVNSYPPLIGGMIAISSQLERVTELSFSMYAWFTDNITEFLIVCSLNKCMHNNPLERGKGT